MGSSYFKLWFIFWICALEVACILGYSKIPRQYHIQTDEGPDRYFRYQTYNGQFRREKRFEDGTVVGTYGWVDPSGLLRLYDYIADHLGYRLVRQRTMKVPPIVEPPPPLPSSHTPIQRQPVSSGPPPDPVTQSQSVTWQRPEPVAQVQPDFRPASLTQQPPEPVAQVKPVLRPASLTQQLPEPVAQVKPVLRPASLTQQQPASNPIAVNRPASGAHHRPTNNPQSLHRPASVAPHDSTNFPQSLHRPASVAPHDSTNIPQPFHRPASVTSHDPTDIPQPFHKPASVTTHELTDIPQRFDKHASLTPIPQPVNRPASHRPGTRLQPINRPHPGTHLRPAIRLRPVQVKNTIPVSQVGSGTDTSRVRDTPKLRPILVPLSQTGALRPSLSSVAPALPDSQLRPVTLALGKSSVSHLLNDVSFPEDLAGSHTELSQGDDSLNLSFGDKDARTEYATEDLSSVTTNTLAERRRLRGRPISPKRISSTNQATTTTTTTTTTRTSSSSSPSLSSSSSSTATGRSRGSIRFRDSPRSSTINQRRRTQTPVPTQQTQSEVDTLPFERTLAPLDSHRDSNVDSTDSIDSSIGNNIRSHDSNDDAIRTSKSNAAGDLTAQGTTNPDTTFDLPPDLPYSINYDLGNQFHLEKTLQDGTKVGKHGYVDPLGVLRVTHYSTGPNGHEQRQENRWVGTRHPEDQK